jgi:hypothetical protein
MVGGHSSSWQACGKRVSGFKIGLGVVNNLLLAPRDELCGRRTTSKTTPSLAEGCALGKELNRAWVITGVGEREDYKACHPGGGSLVAAGINMASGVPRHTYLWVEDNPG